MPSTPSDTAASHRPSPIRRATEEVVSPPLAPDAEARRAGLEDQNELRGPIFFARRRPLANSTPITKFRT